MPKAVDLFAGAGGLSLGFYLAGIDVVGAIENDKNACKTYRYNLGNHIIEEDINLCPPQELEDFMIINGSIQSKSDIDIIAGGPPCFGFSNIGRSKILSLIKKGIWEVIRNRIVPLSMIKETSFFDNSSNMWIF